MPDEQADTVVKEIKSVDELIEMMAASSNVEGEVYVGLDTRYYAKPSIDHDQLYDILQNNYVTEQVERLKSLLFIDRPEIRVWNDDGTEDVELGERLTAMCDDPDVQLWVNMQQAWVDTHGWGCALFNPVWVKDGNEVVLKKLRRLPPESFGDPHQGKSKGSRVYSQILQGITLNEQDEIEYWQTQQQGIPVQLKNVWMVKDPTSTELAGTSKVVPIVPIVRALEFAVQAMLQRVNRVGAPSIFIKVTAPQKTANRDDLAYAQIILENWGKNTAYQLRENMEVVALNFQDNVSAKETVDHLEKRLRQYFTPATLIATEGPTLGEGTEAKADLLVEWLKGVHNTVEGWFERLLDVYFEANMYEGKRADINIPEPEPDDSQARQALASVGFATQSLLPNEIRDLLGFDELDDDMLAVLKEHYAAPAAPPMGFKEDDSRSDDSEEKDDLAYMMERAALRAQERIEKALAEDDTIPDEVLR